MELTGIDNSRVVLLTQVRRPDGQIYLPDAIAKIVERYSFVKAPAPDEALPYTFKIGKFRDSQIAELGIYNDGIIVSSASDTDLLDAFIEDFLSWAMKEFGLQQLTTTPSEKYYESSVVVRSTTDLASLLRPKYDITDIIAEAMQSAKIDTELKFSGAIFDFDVGAIKRKRKPFRLIVDRRVNVSFLENVFFSQAPFRTKDHLEILKSLERIATDSSE
jgi:hypothetical protein